MQGLYRLILPMLGLVMLVVSVQTSYAQKANGQFCRYNQECTSGYCANGRKCAPKDFTGRANDYCHHDNHCASRKCNCNHGSFGFCRNWESWRAGTVRNDPRVGFCEGTRTANGGFCSKNEQCSSGYCANGKRCAPRDGTGARGAYCHHDNHCRTGNCGCPANAKSWGFCRNWEGYSPQRVSRMRSRGQGFACR